MMSPQELIQVKWYHDTLPLIWKCLTMAKGLHNHHLALDLVITVTKMVLTLGREGSGEVWEIMGLWDRTGRKGFGKSFML
jgi:hypothetical protein